MAHVFQGSDEQRRHLFAFSRSQRIGLAHQGAGAQIITIPFNAGQTVEPVDINHHFGSRHAHIHEWP